MPLPIDHKGTGLTALLFPPSRFFAFDSLERDAIFSKQNQLRFYLCTYGPTTLPVTQCTSSYMKIILFTESGPMVENKWK